MIMKKIVKLEKLKNKTFRKEIQKGRQEYQKGGWVKIDRLKDLIDIAIGKSRSCEKSHLFHSRTRVKP